MQSPSRYEAGRGQNTTCANWQRTGTGVDDLPRILFLLTGCSGGFSRQIYDSLFTAADGKIPLSMVQVKFKPQYLVFSMHSLVTGHKTLDFGCGKAQQGTQSEESNDVTASKIVQILPGK
jgi:hypothetical protein